jgi:hypothetical protein
MYGLPSDADTPQHLDKVFGCAQEATHDRPSYVFAQAFQPWCQLYVS